MPFEFAFYYFLLLLALALGLIRWRILDTADRLITVLLVVTFIHEVAAFAWIKWYGSNLCLFHLYNPLQFFLLSLYFNQAVVMLRKWIGVLTGSIGVVASILNTLLIQPVSGVNSNFLLFEGTCIIIYCLLSFHQTLLDEENLPYRFALFWITVCLMFFWGVTFTGWGVFEFAPDGTAFGDFFSRILKVTNYVFYLGFFFIFLLYHRLAPSGYHAR